MTERDTSRNQGKVAPIARYVRSAQGPRGGSAGGSVAVFGEPGSSSPEAAVVAPAMPSGVLVVVAAELVVEASKRSSPGDRIAEKTCQARIGDGRDEVLHRRVPRPRALPRYGQPPLVVIGIEVVGFFTDVEQFGWPHRRVVDVEVGNARHGLIECFTEIIEFDGERAEGRERRRGEALEVVDQFLIPDPAAPRERLDQLGRRVGKCGRVGASEDGLAGVLENVVGDVVGQGSFDRGVIRACLPDLLQPDVSAHRSPCEVVSTPGG
jgi:hypothetical protein